jgi:hypothetical protein
MSPAFRLALLPLVLLACAPPATLSTHAPRGWAALHASEALTLTGALHRAIQGQRTVRVLLDVPFCEVYLTLVADHIHKVAVASADAPGELFRGTILDMRVSRRPDGVLERQKARVVLEVDNHGEKLLPGRLVVASFLRPGLGPLDFLPFGVVESPLEDDRSALRD